MKQTIRKGDNVRVMRGDKDDVGKVGEVIRVLVKEDRVVVQGVNMVKKHQKQQQSGGKTIPSGIMEFEAPLHISNVALVSESEDKTAKKPATKPAKKAPPKTAAKKPAAKATAEKKPAAKAEKKETAKPAEKKAAADAKPAAKKPAAKKMAEK